MSAGLAVTEHEGLAECLGVELSNLLDKDGKCARDVLKPLSLHRRSEACKVDRMPGPERLADLAQLPEAANSWALAGVMILFARELPSLIKINGSPAPICDCLIVPIRLPPTLSRS